MYSDVDTLSAVRFFYKNNNYSGLGTFNRGNPCLCSRNLAL